MRFPQALVGGCALSPLFTGVHEVSGLLQRLSGHLSAAYLCAPTISSRTTETFTIPPWTVGEAVAIQTALESTSEVHICLPDSTLEVG